MTFAERLQHTGRISGRRYEGSARSTSVARESAQQAAASSSAEHTSAIARRGVRAASEMPATAVSSAQAGRESAERQMRYVQSWQILDCPGVRRGLIL